MQRSSSNDSRDGSPTIVPIEEDEAKHVDKKRKGPSMTDEEEEADDSPSHKKQQRYPVEPNAVQFVNMPKIYVNHTYRDFSLMPSEESYEFPAEIKEMTFHEKLYHLLTFSAPAQTIGWCHRGRAFEVLNEKHLTSGGGGILRFYFGCNTVTRFYKQLHNHGYKQLTRDKEKTRFYSEFLLRGLPHVLRYSPDPTTSRRLIHDPDHEPDFAKINQLFPLPGDRKELVEEARHRLQARGVVIYDQIFKSVASKW